MYRKLFRIIGQPLAVTLAFAIVATQYPQVVRADSVSAGAMAGRETATTFRPNVQDLFSTGPNGNLTLFPNAESPILMNSGELYQGSAGQDSTPLTNLHGNDSAMFSAGSAAHTRLQTEGSMDGEAYRTLIGSSQAARPNLTNDPMFNASDNAWNTDFATEFADCRQTTTFNRNNFSAHVPEYRTCERILDQSRTCTIRHQYRAGIIDHVSGPLNLASCGEGCMYVWVGTVGDDYWPGNCSIYEEQVRVNVFNPDAVISATIDYAKWDDYLQVKLNGNLVYNPLGEFPPETPGVCERGTSWEQTPSVDVTPFFKQAGDLEMLTRTSVTGNGEGYARIKVLYDPSKVLSISEYSPEDCEASVVGMSDGFCSGQFQCTDMPATDADGCLMQNGIQLCASTMERIHPDLNPLCRQATVNAQCDFYVGQMNPWVDAQGNQQQPYNNGDDMNSCAALENDPSCGYIRSTCVGRAEGESGTCYVTEEVWDCGHDVDVPTLDRATEMQCSGPIRCMGDECVQANHEVNGDFARVAATLQAAQFMAMDADCNEDTIEENRNCTIFKGDYKYCKRAVGGIVDCCEQPTTVSLGDYMTLILAMGKLNSAVTSLETTNTALSSWQALNGVFDSAWTEVTQPFVSGWNSVWGGTEAVAGAAQEGIITMVKQELLNQVAEFTYQAFGETAANMLFSRAATTAAGEATAAFGAQAGTGALQLGGGAALIGSMLSVIMWVYMIYQIVMILIQIIWACEQEEFELAAQRELKNCHYIGSFCQSEALGVCIEVRKSYCCYNSPISRIIQEQVHLQPQVGMTWGTPEEPNCDGLTTDKMELVDWSAVNLDEWLALLAETGHLPNESTVNIGALTGAGSFFNTGDRTDAAARATERVGSIDVNAIRNQATQELQSMPRP
ncbi:conjugal transfer mating pair stabilization protein TraN [Azospirillum sp. SYSU D00513]|uniref:conjugal transfer mating pair stabilization protein TraN n=1 Tax=Azospirillum sp. SYSU D00513 TaxID=2812561 RepID=UPI001A966BDA|nr:conjugal transfer mating pair stabilization protein TraN [Azospirillum sp. SYSU D00513]